MIVLFLISNNNFIFLCTYTMKILEIFEPAMCCSTWVCWPSINPDLLRISTVINALKGKWFPIKRYNLSSNPQDFVSNKIINDLLQKEGSDILPITILDDELIKTKEYPTNEELSSWLNIDILSNQSKNNDNCCPDWSNVSEWCCSDKNFCDISCAPKKQEPKQKNIWRYACGWGC